MQISPIRLSDKTSRLRPRLVVAKPGQAYESSVLEAYAGKSIHPNHGQRVVNGCRLMQSASDVFLWLDRGPAGRQFYVRQLKDMKVKMLIELFTRRISRPQRSIRRGHCRLLDCLCGSERARP
jgi:Uncharacterized protein conserved in bacteria (DUF2252)